MATNNGRVTNQQTTVDNVSWTTIVAPKDCNSVDIFNVNVGGSAVVLKLRTDSGDATTERQYGPVASASFGGPHTPQHNDNRRFRFTAGETVCFAQLASGSYAIPQSYY